MKTIAAEFATPNVVPCGEYAGTRVVDLPNDYLGVLLREQR